MIVIPISIGTLFGLWLVCGLAYLTLGAVVAIVTWIARLLGRVVPPNSEKAAAQREPEHRDLIEALVRVGYPPDRAEVKALEIVSRALAPEEM